MVAGFRVPAELLPSAEPPKPEDLHPADDVKVPAPTQEEGDEGDPLLDLQDPDSSQVHAVDVMQEDCASVDFGDEGVPDDLEEVPSRPAIEESILAGEVPEKDVEEYFSSLSKPLLTEVLRFAVPLKNRNPEGVLEGLQQICGLKAQVCSHPGAAAEGFQAQVCSQPGAAAEGFQAQACSQLGAAAEGLQAQASSHAGATTEGFQAGATAEGLQAQACSHAGATTEGL